MKITAAAALLVCLMSSASAFQQSGVASIRITSLAMAKNAQTEDLVFVQRRRSFLQNGAAAMFGLGFSGALSQPANAGLLDEYGADPTKIDTPTKVAREALTVSKKVESDLEPNLRSNYYYPTNKKRYLPRIKKCNDLIPDAAVMIGGEDWEAAAEFVDKVAEDTILPMKLYTSSLLGGGTNVKVSFAKDMNQAAADFEKAQKQLSKAVAKKDVEKSTKALEELSKALLTYRTAGKLLGPDGGGDIPSVDDIRRSASRTQKLMFEERLKARDERVKASSS
jgi:hypothetical protein